MAETLRLEIVTPQAIAFSEEVHMVTLQAIDGQIGVYPHHVHLITQLVPGELTVTRDGEDRFLAMGEGLVEVTADRVTIITDMAVAADKIDEAAVEEARARGHGFEELEARMRLPVPVDEVRALVGGDGLRVDRRFQERVERGCVVQVECIGVTHRGVVSCHKLFGCASAPQHRSQPPS